MYDSLINGYCHVLVLIDCFSKWSEGKPIKGNSATAVVQFLYMVNCQMVVLKFKLMTRDVNL